MKQIVIIALSFFVCSVHAQTIPYESQIPSDTMMMEFISTIVSKGQRMPGHPANQWVEDTLITLMNARGLQTTKEPVPNTRFWKPLQYEISITNGIDTLSFPCYPFVYNVNTPVGGVWGNAELYNGTPVGLGGKVVLMDYPLKMMTNAQAICSISEWCYDPDNNLSLTQHINPQTQKSDLADDVEAIQNIINPANRPSAVIAILNNYWNQEKIIGSWKGGQDTTDDNVPCIWVSKSTGDSLKSLMNNGYNQIRVKVEVQENLVTTNNVFGYLPGNDTNNIVLVSTHHDAPFRGGSQDASGIAVVWALMQYWSAVPQIDRPFSFVFYFASAHFDGIRGSKQFVVNNPAIINKTVLNLAFEHNAKEFEIINGQLTSTTRPEPRWVYVTNNSNLEQSVQTSIVTEDCRRVILSNPSITNIPFGDGFEIWKTGVPVVQHVSVPIHLFAYEDDTNMVHEDIDNWVRVYIRIIHDYSNTLTSVNSNFLESRSIILFPNPADGIIHIQFPDLITSFKVKIYNIRGQLVKEESNSNYLDISAFPKGTYVVRVYNQEKIWSRKIIKN